MAEAAGLVLGAIPLVLTALDKYQDCLEVGRSHKNYTNTLDSIRDDVFVQKKLFHGTMKSVGLHEPTYMELDDCLRNRFPDDCFIFMSIITRMAVIIEHLIAKLELDMKGKPDDISSRVAWEWRRVKRSLSTKERKKMFDELQHLNISLRNLLFEPEVPRVEWAPIVQSFVLRYNQKDCDAVRIQASDVKKALDACWQCSCSHQTSLDLDWYTNRPTRSPVFNVSMSYSTMNNQSSLGRPQWRRAKAEVETVGVSSSAGHDKEASGPPIVDVGLLTVPPSQSSTKKQRGSLSSRLRPSSRSASPLPPAPSETAATIVLGKSTKQIDSLCRFIQGLDNGGEPLGFLSVPGGTKRVQLESDPRYCVTEEMTLTQLLPPNTPPAHLILDRRKRLEIAVAAAWTTLLLCDTPWLARLWDKHGLCFFSEDLSAAGPSLADRCVSMTQGCASNPLPTTSIGTNPKNNLIRHEALFALGILLIELGLNQSFEECKRVKNIGTTATNIVDDYWAADRLTEDIFRDLGKWYGNAVRRCIRFCFPGSDTTNNFSHAAFRQEFHNLVVAPIEATLSTTLP